MDDSADVRKYLNYPLPLEGPNVPYTDSRKPNPALKGYPVVISAFLLEWIAPIRRLIWFSAGFGSLRPIRKSLEHYEPRYDPTVVPVASEPYEGHQDSRARQRKRNGMTKSRTGYYSTADYHRLYLSGELTPTAVAKALLPLIRRDTDPAGEHSVAWFDAKVDEILRAAEESTERYRKGTPLGPLDGVPAAVKDEYDMMGYKTCLGSVRDYAGNPLYDGEPITSWCVQKIQEAGVVVLGKLSMYEYGLDTSGLNPNYGTPTNPYNSQYYTGGSSSGPAYAVSAGLIPIALGSDGGGSIRIPSSFCSLYGLKPTHGRVAHHPVPNYANTCAVNGPLAADLESLLDIYRVIGEPHPSSQFPALSCYPYRTGHANKILAIPETWFQKATPAIQAMCRRFIDNLAENYGYGIIPIDIPYLVEGQIAHAMTVLTDAATLLPDTRRITAPNKILLALGRTTPSTDYLLAQKLRGLLMQHLAYLWKKWPGMIIVTPTTSCAGWPMRSTRELKYGVSDGDQTMKTMEYVWMANFLGLPSLSMPAGYVIPEGKENAGEEATEDTEGKIPIGIMGMAEWTREEQLMQWGFDAEEIVNGLRDKPSIWVDVVELAKQEMESDAKAADADGAAVCNEVEVEGDRDCDRDAEPACETAQQSQADDGDAEPACETARQSQTTTNDDDNDETPLN